MRYRVHRLDIELDTEHRKREEFHNNLGGDVISIFTNVGLTFQEWEPRQRSTSF